MENKTGRKYNRQRWGWKNEGELPNNTCNYSGLPSMEAYKEEFKHPYYDSDERKRKRRDSVMIAGWSFVGMIVIIILTAIMK